jgi:hypothetical protein
LSGTYPLIFAGGNAALAQDVIDPADLPGILRRLGAPRPVLVLVGGAASLDASVAPRIATLFSDRLAPLLDGLGAAVIDGGTNSGVMALIGQARAQAGSAFPLIGVPARGTVCLPRRPEPPGHRGTPLEPNHTHFLLVPGEKWGDESPWISAAAAALAGGEPSATLAIGGGRVTRQDLDQSLRAGRQVLLLDGSGGTTGDIGRAYRANDLAALGVDPRQAGLLRMAGLDDVDVVLDRVLRARRAR